MDDIRGARISRPRVISNGNSVVEYHRYCGDDDQTFTIELDNKLISAYIKELQRVRDAMLLQQAFNAEDRS